MIDRAVWRKCRSIVDRLSIPAPFDPDLFISALAERRGRVVELVPMPGPAVQCGALVATDEVDYIFYATSTTRLHREHILLHEAGHLLCGHIGEVDPGLLPEILFPHLGGDLIRRVLGRTDYSAAEEQEAELVASMISQRARRRPAGSVAPEIADGLARVGSIFDSR
ncbi:ImmA/IrrE family metallo-endopeptidase [Sphaerimonospora sp. CA-214678]|uniref:ImmA/IrrE family metallo-endopeptidase n=1 Tax=Sphaerimonospora sp. CA-214678 TaxID=3240029 RepID=UPI003D902B96